MKYSAHSKIKTIIVDDEPIARQRIADLLDEYPAFEIVGEYENGLLAQEILLRETIHLLFVDIKMPRMDGISLVKSLSAEKRPMVVFSTAYDEFALDAFDLFAIDYLLKPFSKKRFRETISKIEVLKNGLAYQHQINGLLSAFDKTEKVLAGEIKRLRIKLGDRMYFIRISDIEYITSSGNYLEVFAENRSHIYRETMTNIIRQLSPDFIRIHKSTIVNMSYIKEIISIGHGDYELLTTNGRRLRVSATFKKEVLEILSKG
ncbi:MAG: LytTR family transcriptional regulator DNA-binding domain-containing protein [Cyclobacteriaceae bacterium]